MYLVLHVEHTLLDLALLWWASRATSNKMSSSIDENIFEVRLVTSSSLSLLGMADVQMGDGGN